MLFVAKAVILVYHFYMTLQEVEGKEEQRAKQELLPYRCYCFCGRAMSLAVVITDGYLMPFRALGALHADGEFVGYVIAMNMECEECGAEVPVKNLQNQ